MNRLAIDDGTAGNHSTVHRQPLPNDWNRSVLRPENEFVAVPQYHRRVVGFAKPAGALDDGFENRPDIGRRGGDHAEDVCTAGLVSQRLLQLAGLGLHLIEQPGILDGDDGLVGEGLDER